MTTVAHAQETIDATVEVMPGVWRWADPAGSDRCGTALATDDGLVLIDPPALPGGALAAWTAAGPVRHVILTGPALVSLAWPFTPGDATIWIPGDAPLPAGMLQPPVALRRFGPGDPLPGELLACQLPVTAAPTGEVALLWPPAGDGLLITGDILPVIGQTPVYREGEAPPIDVFHDAVRALLSTDPGTLAPSHQAPENGQVAYSTGYAAHIGSVSHARRAAPVSGPRFLVPLAPRILQDVLNAPVVLRQDPAGGWIADPFACARCGQPNEPMPQTCGGPRIARLCAACRDLRRQLLPAARVMICAGGCCTRLGARAAISATRQATRAHGLDATVDVVPVTCLGECSVGPFLRVSLTHGEEPAFAASHREQATVRAREFAAGERETLDAASELVMSRFAAMLQPAEAARLIEALDATLNARS